VTGGRRPASRSGELPLSWIHCGLFEFARIGNICVCEPPVEVFTIDAVSRDSIFGSQRRKGPIKRAKTPMTYASPTLMESSERCVATLYLAELKQAATTHTAALTKDLSRNVLERDADAWRLRKGSRCQRQCAAAWSWQRSARPLRLPGAKRPSRSAMPCGYPLLVTARTGHVQPRSGRGESGANSPCRPCVPKQGTRCA
jgi:hypothetical protein